MERPAKLNYYLSMPSALNIVLFIMFVTSTAARAGSAGNRPPSPLSQSRQCLLLRAKYWHSKKGDLQLLERTKTDAPWEQRGPSIPVSLGKNGLAWGRGVVAFDMGGPKKMEGDGRSPAGVFRLGTVFGYASATNLPRLKMPYLALTDESEAVDDPQSRYYNQLVRRSAIAEPDWHSSEQMRRSDVLYRWGVFVEQNTPAVAGAGSCVFLHNWRSPKAPTVGCTAMPESDLKALIAWLDPDAQPLLIQLPLSVFRRIQPAWFPELEAK
jgi:D-alanyl-D-alanine dipeptidase